MVAFLLGVHMTEAVVSLDKYKQDIRPKRELHKYQGHSYELVFDPKAAPDQRWVWIVRYTHVYIRTGSASTINKAATAARKQIRTLAGV